MGGNHRHADFLKLACQQRHFVPTHAALQHIHSGDAEHDDEVIAHCLAASFGHFKRKAHTVFIRAAPFIGALIGFLNQKSRQQITGRADNFDPVITGLFGHGGAMGVVGNLFFNARRVQFFGRESANARFDRRGRNRLVIIGERPHMQNLHNEFAVGRGIMHGLCHNGVAFHFFFVLQLGGGEDFIAIAIFHRHAAFGIGGNAAGDNHADTAGRALGIISRHAFKSVWQFLKAGMHGAHNRAVFNGGMTQIQRLKQARIFGVTR